MITRSKSKKKKDLEDVEDKSVERSRKKATETTKSVSSSGEKFSSSSSSSRSTANRSKTSPTSATSSSINSSSSLSLSSSSNAESFSREQPPSFASMSSMLFGGSHSFDEQTLRNLGGGENPPTSEEMQEFVALLERRQRQQQLEQEQEDMSPFSVLLRELSKESPDPSDTLIALDELCNLLALATEESIQTFRPREFSKVLTSILSNKNNGGEIRLVAIRTLSHMFEIFPRSKSYAVQYGVVDSLCTELMSPEYMDVVEQAIQSLARLSKDTPGALSHMCCSRAVEKLLGFIDFFPVSVQRVASETSARICSAVKCESLEEQFGSVLNTLTSRISHGDNECAESTLKGFRRMVERLQKHSDAAMVTKSMEFLCRHGLIQQCIMHIPSESNQNISSTSSSSSSFTASSTMDSYTSRMCQMSMIVLGTLAKWSSKLTIDMLKQGVAGQLAGILRRSTSNGNFSSSTSFSSSFRAVPKSPSLDVNRVLNEALTLVNDMLPNPDDKISLKKVNSSDLKWGKPSPIGRSPPSSSTMPNIYLGANASEGAASMAVGGSVGSVNDARGSSPAKKKARKKRPSPPAVPPPHGASRRPSGATMAAAKKIAQAVDSAVEEVTKVDEMQIDSDDEDIKEEQETSITKQEITTTITTQHPSPKVGSKRKSKRKKKLRRKRTKPTSSSSTTASSTTASSTTASSASSYSGIRYRSHSSHSSDIIAPSAAVPPNRCHILDEESDLFAGMVELLLPSLLDAYGTVVQAAARHWSLSALEKMIKCLPAASLKYVMSQGDTLVRFSEFIASLLMQQDDTQIVVVALTMARIVLEKSPLLCGDRFLRDGVIAAAETQASKSVPGSRPTSSSSSSSMLSPSSNNTSELVNSVSTTSIGRPPSIRRGLSPARAAAEAARRQATAAVSEAMTLLRIFHGDDEDDQDVMMVVNDSSVGGSVGGVAPNLEGSVDLESSISSFVSLDDSGIVSGGLSSSQVLRKNSKVLLDLQVVASQLNESVDQDDLLRSFHASDPSSPTSTMLTSDEAMTGMTKIPSVGGGNSDGGGIGSVSSSSENGENGENGDNIREENDNSDSSLAQKRKRKETPDKPSFVAVEEDMIRTLGVLQALLVNSDSISTHELLQSGVVEALVRFMTVDESSSNVSNIGNRSITNSNAVAPSPSSLPSSVPPMGKKMKKVASFTNNRVNAGSVKLRGRTLQLSRVQKVAQMLSPRRPSSSTSVPSSRSSMLEPQEEPHPMRVLVGALQKALTVRESFPLTTMETMKMRPRQQRDGTSSYPGGSTERRSDTDGINSSKLTQLEDCVELFWKPVYLSMSEKDDTVSSVSADKKTARSGKKRPRPIRIRVAMVPLAPIQILKDKLKSKLDMARAMRLRAETAHDDEEDEDASNNGELDIIIGDDEEEEEVEGDKDVGDNNDGGSSKISTNSGKHKTKEDNKDEVYIQLNGVDVNDSMTVLEVLYRYKYHVPLNMQLPPEREVWGKEHEMSFGVRKKQSPRKKRTTLQRRDSFTDEVPFSLLTSLSSSSSNSIVGGMTSEVEQLMSLLRVFHEINCSIATNCTNNSSNTTTGKVQKNIYADYRQPSTPQPNIPQEIFINSKLTAKLSTQLHDPLTVVCRCIPPWCGLVMRECPFLFPFELRRMYFFTTGLVPQQSFKYLVKHEEERAGEGKGTNSTNRSNLPSDRTNKPIKLEVSRDDGTILKDAIVALEEYARRSVDYALIPTLEVRFVNEVGTGEGPTREFCNLISKELQRKDLQLWRHEGQMEQNVNGRSDNGKNQDIDNATYQNGVVEGGKAVAGSTSSSNSITPSSSSFDISSSSAFVNAPYGLFPAPSPNVHAHMGGGIDGETSPFRSLYETYVFLGRMFAFALVSGRTIDLSLSAPLRRAILESGQTVQNDRKKDRDSSSSSSTTSMQNNVNVVKEALNILKDVDPAMCRHLKAFQMIATAREDAINSGQKIDVNDSSMCFQGAPIDMLCLDFTLPGDSEFELMPDGANVAVSVENIGEYVLRICEVMVLEPLKQMSKGIRQGMSSMFDPNHLRCFNEDELELLLCGTPGSWTSQELHEHIQTNHGYSRDSIAVQQLLTILSSFDPHQQRQFLKFVTGSPRLPVGGLSALRPSLTVVRKENNSSSSSSSSNNNNNNNGSGSSGNTSGGSLPSASTCTSYLKLPEYGSIDVMREKLLLAISEGQGSFHLS